MNSFHFVVFHLGNQQGNLSKGIDKKTGRREGIESTKTVFIYVLFLATEYKEKKVFLYK